ncbi:lactonase family protein [Nonomuraea typhae]|uniref:lactonase family protein n=1 Tax=Nonomuraea typhae TaxID=2603600 RepID=UPI0012FB3D45|nr:beta-propeller fold lactonase family protein [Nonomuraea typhae]
MKHLYIGGYGDGILTAGAGLTPAPAPSFLAAHPALPVLYAVGELAEGVLQSFSTAGGAPAATGRRPSGGDSPCHLAVHPSGTLLAVANYGDGVVSLHHLDGEGRFTGEPIVLPHTGSGPHPGRQRGPHAHQCVFHGDVLHVPDLGTDEIRRYTLAGEPLEPVRLAPGMGPRHLVFSGERVYVAGELDGTLRAYAAGDWRELFRVKASGADGVVYPSHVDVSGGRVYLLNRGPDTIAVFSADGDPLAEVDSGGEWPRHFAIDGGTLWVANQNSASVAVFALAGGVPGATGEIIEVKSPACVLPV